jgi:bifunctional non-homologous end joining protein LigD
MTTTDAKSPPDESHLSAEDRLKKYREKRDFDLTPEPAGGTAAPRAKRPFFCVQKHAASRLHYDVRLEVHGVLKSWAVPKGPSPDPTEKRLAVMVEDHPLEYGDFEGTIPEGEYGGGTVLLWDIGWWEPDLTRRKPVKPPHPDAPPVEGATTLSATVPPGPPPDPEADLAGGELKFILHGEKLRGSYTLVQMKGRGEKNWLMIKHRDDDAHPGLDLTLEAPLSVSSGRSIEEIAEDASSAAG